MSLLVLPITLAILSFRCEKSLFNTLDSYNSSGLLSYVNETIIFVQEINDSFIKKFSVFPVKVFGSVENVRIAPALEIIFAAASNPVVLFAEKDFEIVNFDIDIYEELKQAYDLIIEDKAHLYQLRSRFHGGIPNWGMYHYRGKEKKMEESDYRIICWAHHWIKNPTIRWPNHFSYCQPINNTSLSNKNNISSIISPNMNHFQHSSTLTNHSNHHLQHNIHPHPKNTNSTYCISSRYCPWTNNPFLTTKRFWRHHISPVMQDIMTTKNDIYLLVEQYFHAHPDIWAMKNYTIAIGRGIFRHNEIDC